MSQAAPPPVTTLALDRSDAPSLRLTNWDRLRVIAALDIVAFHLTGGHAFRGIGLPVLLMVSTALAVSKPAPPPTATFVRRRVDRIVMPWLFWSLVIVGTRVVTSVADGRAPFGWVEWPMALYGPRIHLWFLPFIFVAGVAAHTLHLLTRRRDPRWPASVALVVGVALLTLPEIGRAPFGQWCFAVPSIFLGFALGRLVAGERDLDRLRKSATSGYAVFCLLVALAVLAVPSSASTALRFAGALGLLVAAVWLPNRGDRVTGRLVPLMLGVYVLHVPLWINLVRPVMNAADLTDTEWLRVAVTFPFTMAVVAALRRTRVERVL